MVVVGVGWIDSSSLCLFGEMYRTVHLPRGSWSRSDYLEQGEYSYLWAGSECAVGIVVLVVVLVRYEVVVVVVCHCTM